MRASPLPLLSLILLACGTTPAPSAPNPSGPASATTPTEPAAAPDVWAAVPLADGATALVGAAEHPFTNAAGQIACPVMGSAIAAAESAVSYADHDGTRYYFCCDSCEKLFLDDPTAYASGKYLRDHDLDPTATCGDGEKIEG